MVFYRGNIIIHGGCEMHKECYNKTYIMNINDICPNKCSEKGTCDDTIGCKCNAEYILHDCSMKMKCKSDCSNNGICHSSGRCNCYFGWSGNICESLIPCPGNCTSSENGYCQIDTTCKCNAGFTGKDCSDLTIIGKEELLSEDPFKALTELQAEEIAKETAEILTQQSSCKNDCSRHGVCDKYNKVCKCDVNIDLSRKDLAEMIVVLL